METFIEVFEATVFFVTIFLMAITPLFSNDEQSEISE